MIKELEGLIYGTKLIELNMHRSIKWQLGSVGEDDIAVCNYQRGVNKETKSFTARYSCGFLMTHTACHMSPWGALRSEMTACPPENLHQGHFRVVQSVLNSCEAAKYCCMLYILQKLLERNFKLGSTRWEYQGEWRASLWEDRLLWRTSFKEKLQVIAGSWKALALGLLVLLVSEEVWFPGKSFAWWTLNLLLTMMPSAVATVEPIEASKRYPWKW